MLNEAAELVINNNQLKTQIDRYKGYLPKLDLEGKNLQNILWQLEKIQKELHDRGILIKAASMKIIAEEAPGAYKDIDQVVQVSHDLEIIEKIVKLTPIGVVKG